MTPLDKELLRLKDFDKYEVICELKRELEMRAKLYPAWCATGRIQLATAADRIRLLEIALTDLQELYREKADPPILQVSLFPIEPEPISQFRTNQS
jgi:hypothetical protein